VLLAQAAVLGFSAGASPGPFQALLLQRAVRVGPRRALHLALVPLVSDPVVIAACLFVLSGLPGGLLRALQLLGGALLCWMGAVALKELASPAGGQPGAPGPAPAESRGFWSAALVNLLNPNAWLFWSLIGGPLLAGALRAGPTEAALFLLAFYLPLVGVNAALVSAFGAAGRLGPAAARILGGVSALAFLSLGLVQLWHGALGAP
jgi:threonine/homoserine/homoserine lactone efflux protein